MTKYNCVTIVQNVQAAIKALGIAPNEMVIGAGAACVLRGLRLQTDDIDVAICDPVLFEKLKHCGDFDVKYFNNADGTPGCSVEYTGGVSIHLDERPFDQFTMFMGVLCYTHEQLLEQYSTLNREKDQIYIEMLKSLLGV